MDTQRSSESDEGYARIGAALFIAGAVKYVTQQWQLDDATYLAIIGTLVVKAGITPEEQVHFSAADLVTIPEGSPEWRMAEKGFNAAQEWLADKGYTAVARLARYVKEWAGQSTEQPA